MGIRVWPTLEAEVEAKFARMQQEYSNSPTATPSPPASPLACLPKSTSAQDAGYIDAYRGWYDVQGCGRCYDYCRWVGLSGSGGDPSRRLQKSDSFWSCRLAGSPHSLSSRNH